jgi:translation initiation factor IF-3
MNVQILSALRSAAPLHRSACTGRLTTTIPSTRSVPRRTAATATAAARRFRNEKIPFPIVRLVDPVTKSLCPPAPLLSVLAQIKDPKTHHVELVTDTPQPIVRIVDTKEEHRKYKEQKQRVRASAKAQERKEIQLTWGVASGDFLHKLDKVRQELQRGAKVDLIFAPKRRQPLPGKQDVIIRLQETLQALSDVGKECAPRKEENNVVVLHLKPLEKQQQT